MAKKHRAALLSERFVHKASCGFSGQIIAPKALRFLAEPLGNIKKYKIDV